MCDIFRRRTFPGELVVGWTGAGHFSFPHLPLLIPAAIIPFIDLIELTV